MHSLTFFFLHYGKNQLLVPILFQKAHKPEFLNQEVRFFCFREKGKLRTVDLCIALIPIPWVNMFGTLKSFDLNSGHLSLNNERFCTWISIVALFIIVKNYKEFRCPSTSKWCIYLHWGTLLKNRETDTGYNLDESLGNCAEWKKSILKSYMPYAFIYTFFKWKNFRNGKLISDCQGKGRK